MRRPMQLDPRPFRSILEGEPPCAGSRCGRTFESAYFNGLPAVSGAVIVVTKVIKASAIK
jgi:hypothetical protein